MEFDLCCPIATGGRRGGDCSYQYSLRVESSVCSVHFDAKNLAGKYGEFAIPPWKLQPCDLRVVQSQGLRCHLNTV